MKYTLSKQSSIRIPVLVTAFVLAIGLFFFLTLFINRSPANAASTIGFRAGNIIDDAVFTNKNTMSVAQIQAFLNSKVPLCDTNGTLPSEFGGGTRAQWGQTNHGQSTFVCLKDYVESGKSSAQIIYDAAQEFNINPQVLLVLLQKEQGLVTDTWPLNIQYRSATGYGCPDTAPCDSQYYGLTNQLRWAARMFRAIMNASPTWYTPYLLGNNFIQYSPNSSCGGSIVSIENRATQALYNYTPYQPNQAALSAGWGTVSCGAYGNRNFYLYFVDWFGSTRYIFGSIPSYASAYARTNCTITLDPSNVARLYQPDSRDFLYTSSSTEACVAVSYGYIWDGIVMKSANPTDADAIPIYRLADPQRHIYTSSAAVRDDLIANSNYRNEGISFYAYSSAGAGRTPVYGLQLADTFFITSSGREAVYYEDVYGYYNFGAIFYTPTLNTGQTQVFRLNRNNSRLYTTSTVEKSEALSRYGFSDEGTVSTNDIGPNTDNTPLYRLRSPSGKYFYTLDRVERDYAVINYSYLSEGIGFYSLLWSNSPVYRSSNYTNGLKIFTNSQTEYSVSAQLYGYRLEGFAWFSY